MTRICKKNGYIFISVPSFAYAKHEYPIDLWRFGPKILAAFFNHPSYRIVHLETEGDPRLPRRTMLLVKKVGEAALQVTLPVGAYDSARGLTVFE